MWRWMGAFARAGLVLVMALGAWGLVILAAWALWRLATWIGP